MISVIESQPAGSGVDLVKQVEDIFSANGLLSRAKNFEYRPQQQKMAVAVARALQNREHLAVEAGTGVGKSLAYLVPAILFAVAQKKKAVVSTHTINLQEQLTEKDLPMLAGVLAALPDPVKFNDNLLISSIDSHPPSLVFYNAQKIVERQELFRMEEEVDRKVFELRRLEQTVDRSA